MKTKAELKLPKFDEKAAKDKGAELACKYGTGFQATANQVFNMQIDSFQDGARWQHQQDAKVIAAKELQSEQLRRDNLLKYEKIRELEVIKFDQDKLFIAYEECRADNIAHFRKIMELQKEIQAANSLIDELDQILKFCSLENASRREVAFHANESLEKIKQWKDKV